MDTTKYDYERGWIQMLFSTRQGGLHVKLSVKYDNKKQSHFFVSGKLPWGTSLQKSLQMQIRSDHIWVHRQPGRRWGRVSVSTSLRGSMTVEASLIMSLFLLMISVLFSLFQLISYQTEIQFYLEEAVRNQAIYGVSEAGIPASVRNLTPGTGLELGESGVSMIRNGKMRADYLDFTVCYEAGPALHVLEPGREHTFSEAGGGSGTDRNGSQILEKTTRRRRHMYILHSGERCIIDPEAAPIWRFLYTGELPEKKWLPGEIKTEKHTKHARYA